MLKLNIKLLIKFSPKSVHGTFGTMKTQMRYKWKTDNSRFSIKTFVWFSDVDGRVEHCILEYVSFLTLTNICAENQLPHEYNISWHSADQYHCPVWTCSSVYVVHIGLVYIVSYNWSQYSARGGLNVYIVSYNWSQYSARGGLNVPVWWLQEWVCHSSSGTEELEIFFWTTTPQLYMQVHIIYICGRWRSSPHYA